MTAHDNFTGRTIRDSLTGDPNTPEQPGENGNPTDFDLAARVAYERDDLIYMAWTIIANAGGGDWTRETEEWRGAATRWRDRWHATLPNSATPTEMPL